MAGLDVRIAEGRLRTTVWVGGVLGRETAPDLAAALRDATRREPRQVVVSCRAVTAVTDAAGLAPLVAAANEMRHRGGRLWLAGRSRPVDEAVRRAGGFDVVETGTPLDELVSR